MKRETELLLNGFKAEVKDILQNFDEIINAKIETVTIDNVTQKATLKDRIELLESEWSNTVELLDEIGIKVEKDDIDASHRVNKNHYKVYADLVKCMESAGKENEISELCLKDICIKYDSISIDEGGNDSHIITLYRDGVNDKNTGEEVARIVLNGGTEYEVQDLSKKGYYPELIKK